MKVLELEDLTIRLLDGDKCQLQTGRLNQWEDLETIRIECDSGQYTLVHCLTRIDIEAPEAEKIAKMFNVTIYS